MRPKSVPKDVTELLVTGISMPDLKPPNVSNLLDLARENQWENVENLLKKCWSNNCPVIFKPNSDPWNLSIDEISLKEHLLLPLINIMVNDLNKPAGSENLEWPEFVKAYFDEFCFRIGFDKNVRGAGQICGKLFRNGDPTYSCKECALDPTCVMCHECFFASEHAKHKYKLHASGGSGYCDCGDFEAWKMGHTCKNHTLDQNEIVQESSLPEFEMTRMSNLLSILLSFCVNSLCKSFDSPDLMPDGTFALSDFPHEYQCILLNDEHHTYDQVIDALKRAIGCTKEQAQILATIVDREGRSSVIQGTEEQCRKSKTITEERTSREGASPLRVLIMNSCLVSLQQFAIKIITLINQMVDAFPPLVSIVGKLIMKRDIKSNENSLIGQSIILNIITKEENLWKSARVAWHQLLMSSVLMENQLRFEFAKDFTECYSHLMTSFVSDDHEQSLSCVSLSVQIFTVPSIARFVIQESHALNQLIDTIQTLLHEYIVHVHHKEHDYPWPYSFQSRRMPLRVKRALLIFGDLKYLLTVAPKIEEWTTSLILGVNNFASPLVNFMSRIQGMDSVCRVTENHQEYESEWETAFNIQLRLQNVLPLFREWIFGNLIVYKNALENFVGCKRMKHYFTDINYKMDHKVLVTGIPELHEFLVCKHFVSRDKISVHSPLTRFIASIYPHPFFEECGNILTRNLALIIFEFSIRVIVLMSQSSANLWRRNGFTIINQLHNYTNALCRTEMFDKDIMGIQMASRVFGCDELVLRICHKFGYKHKSFTQAPLENIEISSTMAIITEEMILLFITLFGERVRFGVGLGVSEKDDWRRDVIHLLSRGQSSFSELEKSMPNSHKLDDNATLEQIVRQVANFRKLTSISAGEFELKDECWKEINQFYYHFSKEDLSQVEKSLGTKRIEVRPVCAPFCPVKFTEPYIHLTFLAQCQAMIIFIQDVINQWIKTSTSSSDVQMQRIIYFVGIAVEDEISNGTIPRFTEKAAEPSLNGESLCVTFDKLVTSDLLKSQPDHVQLLVKWVYKRFKHAISFYKGEEMEMGENVDEIENEEDLELKRQKKKAKAVENRMKAIEQMKKLQKVFLQKNANLLDPVLNEDTTEFMEEDTPLSEFPICLGVEKTNILNNDRSTKVTCVLCQENERLSFTGNAMVLVSYIQQSTVMSKCRMEDRVINEEWKEDPLILPANLFLGTHTSTCGHSMHSKCWKVFFDSLSEKERNRPFRLFMLSRSVDVTTGEYPCPLCNRLSNSALPMVPNLAQLNINSEENVQSNNDVTKSLTDWILDVENKLNNSEPHTIYSQMNKSGENVAGPSTRKLRSRTKSSTIEINSEDEQNSSVPDLLDSSDSEGDSVPLSEGLLQILQSMPPMLTKARNNKNNKHKQKHSKRRPKGVEISDELLTAMETFAVAVHKTGLNFVGDDVMEPSVIILSWQTTVYSIRNMAALLSKENKPLFGALNTRQSECLNSLVNFGCVSQFFANTKQMQILGMRLIKILIGNSETLISQVDILNLVMNLLMCGPFCTQIIETHGKKKNSVYRLPIGCLFDWRLMNLGLGAFLFQVFATFKSNKQMMQGNPKCELNVIDSTYSQVINRLGTEPILITDELSKSLETHIKYALGYFLRPMALFFHTITKIPPPEALRDPSIAEFEPLCRFLGLPTNLEDILKLVKIDYLWERWLSLEITEPELIRICQPVTLNSLISLPQEFSHLIHKAAQFRCSSIPPDEIRSPTICLLCGVWICSQSFCCQKHINNKLVGACTHHAHFCTAGQGIFLRIRDCKIVLQSKKVRGCFKLAPYVDEFGENDDGFRRGNPLKLQPQFYANIEKIWLHHNISEEISNRQDIESRNLNLDWSHL